MTAYIKLDDGTLHTQSSIRAANPQTSYPASFPCPEGYAIVFPAPQPAHDSMTQFCREIAPVLTVKGTYEQAWEIVALDAETIAAKQAEADSAHNASVLAQITELEKQQARPVRELTLDAGNTFAANKLAQLDADIAALRVTLK